MNRAIKLSVIAAAAAAGIASAAFAVTLNGSTRGVDSVDQYNRAVQAFSTGSFADSLTAAGSGQSTCLQLWNQTSRLTTVAASSGVCLPNTASQPPGIANGSLAGGSITIINAGANPVTVYGFAAADTINGVAYNVGVTQMPNSAASCYVANVNSWICQGLSSGYSTSFATQSYANGLVAGTTQSAAGGTPITTQIAEFDTVASNNNAATLPPAQPGMQISVLNNDASHTLTVYAATQSLGGVSGGDTVNGGASVNMSSPPVVTIFFSTKKGVWVTK